MTDQQDAAAAPPWVGRGQERQQPPTLLALRDLVAAGSRVNHTVARRAGLSATELVTLEHLSREQIGPAEVARRLEVSTAAATGIVDRLVSRGHVERRRELAIDEIACSPQMGEFGDGVRRHASHATPPRPIRSCRAESRLRDRARREVGTARVDSARYGSNTRSVCSGRRNSRSATGCAT